jgi:hypothetical protein
VHTLLFVHALVWLLCAFLLCDGDGRAATVTCICCTGSQSERQIAFCERKFAARASPSLLSQSCVQTKGERAEKDKGLKMAGFMAFGFGISAIPGVTLSLVLLLNIAFLGMNFLLWGRVSFEMRPYELPLWAIIRPVCGAVMCWFLLSCLSRMDIVSRKQPGFSKQRYLALAAMLSLTQGVVWLSSLHLTKSQHDIFSMLAIPGTMLFATIVSALYVLSSRAHGCGSLLCNQMLKTEYTAWHFFGVFLVCGSIIVNAWTELFFPDRESTSKAVCRPAEILPVCRQRNLVGARLRAGLAVRSQPRGD